jgi:hypothetical protein
MTYLPHRRVVAPAIIVSLLLGATIPTSEIAAQDTNHVSASLLRVLGEVADLYRTGRPVFLVADYRFPHHVIGNFSSRPDAERLRADSGSTFGVFGPYVTPVDPPDTASSRIIGVNLVWQTPRGRVVRRLDSNVDALFLTPSAIDKFVIPYYSRLYGPRYAQELRRPPTGARPICHIQTNRCYPRPDGGLDIPRVLKPGGGPLE